MVLPVTVKPAESTPTNTEGKIESFEVICNENMQKARAGHRFYDRSVDCLEREATDEPWRFALQFAMKRLPGLRSFVMP